MHKPMGRSPGPGELLGGRYGFGLGSLSQEATCAQSLLEIDQALAAKSFQAQQGLITGG